MERPRGTGRTGPDCHRRILDAAGTLLAQAQQQGTARGDLSADDIVQLVVGIALSTARSHDAAQPERLLALVLDTVRGGRKTPGCAAEPPTNSFAQVT
ncbi:hypothetical protein [Streptomyces sp. NBC_01142]|uniref:SbtR family transcriptional regulator n=1 Tax=Streptomyces sp. NBC_01142 TaxID=2975865 RepID=UPI002B1D4138|nr:hypothetical protein [Streptomyces sp. NBC_01142]